MILINEKGFSLLEVILTVALLAIMAGVSLQIMSGNTNAQRYEETREKMDRIKIAIFGDDSLDAKGERANYGYFGDMGMLPATLSSLTTQGSQPSWAFNTQYQIGVGWRGPYYTDKFTTASAVDVDAWGTSFTWTTAGTPTLTSVGSNKAAGTTADPYSKDLTMTFPTSVRLSSVRGFVRDNDTRVPNAKVEIRYPSAGAIATYSATTDSDGAFTFNTIPFTRAAMSVASVPITGLVELGPRQVSVAAAQLAVPNFLLNYYGGKQKITVSGTITNASDASNRHIDIPINNSWDRNLNLDYFTINWSGGPAAFAEFVAVGAAAPQALTGLGGVNCAPSGRVVGQIPAGQQFASNTANINLRLSFSAAADCSGLPAAVMTGANMYIEFQWKETTDRDVISFAVP